MTRQEARERTLAYLATVIIATITLQIELAIIPAAGLDPTPTPSSYDAPAVTILVATALLTIGLSLWVALTGVVHIVRPLSLASTGIAIGGLVLIAAIMLLVVCAVIEAASFDLGTWRLLLDQSEFRLSVALGLAVFCAARLMRHLAEGL